MSTDVAVVRIVSVCFSIALQNQSWLYVRTLINRTEVCTYSHLETV